MAEDQLFKWSDDFDLTPPSSFFNCDPKNTNTGIQNGHNSDPLLRFEAIFVVPDFDEMDELARDPSTNDLIRLSERQLGSLRLRGEFDVDSARFPNHRHRWRLNRFFQKGTANTSDSFLKVSCGATPVLLCRLP